MSQLLQVVSDFSLLRCGLNQQLNLRCAHIVPDVLGQLHMRSDDHMLINAYIHVRLSLFVC